MIKRSQLQPTLVWSAGGEREMTELPLPLPLDELAPGGEQWEVELGFGKGRFLLAQAARLPARRYLGIEIVSQYYRLARDRAARRGLGNVVLIRGEAMYLMATALDRRWAEAVHVYFPDPWPKDRHRKRRLFDTETIDLLLALLRPGGRLFFASDHLEYGAVVREILSAHPAADLEVVDGGWPEGARTNYEAKFVADGRPIVRLVATLGRAAAPDLLHPDGRSGVIVAARGDG